MNELPSRYQIGDKVSVHGRTSMVIGVYFSEDKVAYTVIDDRNGAQSTLLSEDVFPENSALRAVK